MVSITVTAPEAGRRLDKLLAVVLDLAPKGFIYKSIRKKNIKLNGARAAGSEILKAGDEIELFFSDATLASLRSSGGAAADKSAGRSLSDYCRIVYEDGNIIIADKAAGVLSQKAKASDYSLNEALLDHMGGIVRDASFTPSVCNRLDRNTSGLVIFAKTYAAARVINDCLKERSIRKYYLAAVLGKVSSGGRLESWLVKDRAANTVSVSETAADGAARVELKYEPYLQNKDTASAVRSLSDGTRYTLLKVELVTGKTHQIRAQLAHAGHPLLGDPKYGDKRVNSNLKQHYGIEYQLLHSMELTMPDFQDTFLSGLSGRTFLAEIPERFLRLAVR